jgi:hypothetical protein
MRNTMDKHLLGLIWGLPSSFALPSVAACRCALADIRLRLTELEAANDDHRLARSRMNLRLSRLA